MNIRYWKPWRKFLIKLCNYVSDSLGDKICDYLYPDNIEIYFKESEL